MRIFSTVGKPFAAVALAFALLITLMPSAASAHSAEQSLLYLNISDKALAGTIEYPFRDIREVFGVELDGTDDEIIAEIESIQDELFSYATDHLSIGADGVEWDLTFNDFELFREEGVDLEFVVSDFVATVPNEVVPRVLDISFDPFFDEIENRDGLLLIGNDWAAGVFDNGEEGLLTYTPERRDQVVDLGDTSQWKNFSASVALGLDHIKTGPDHILFVLALLLPAVLIFSSGSWKPTKSFTASLWRILKIATMFTIAHSITFTLAGLGILPLPSSKIVEAIIAISIAAAALHNIKPIFPNREWTLSFVFGLFHGMGFASLVSGLEASQTTQLVSLMGRNVGIEIGQAAVIIMMFPMLFMLRRTRLYRAILVGGSAALAVVSIGWAIERVFEISLGTDTLVEKFVRLPRTYYAIAILTAIAAAYRWFEGQRGALIDVEDSDDSDGLGSPIEPQLEVSGTKV